MSIITMILARNRQQAEEIAFDKGLRRKDWLYAGTNERLTGLSAKSFQMVISPDWHIGRPSRIAEEMALSIKYFKAAGGKIKHLGKSA